MEKQVATDLPKAISLLADVSANLKDANTSVQNLLQKLKESGLNTDKGFSIFELKNDILLMYIMDLVYVAMRKLHGESIKDHQSIEHLVELRTSLERLKPMEEKLNYQKEKYLKISKEGLPSGDDPSRLSGDLENIVMSSDEDSDEDNEGKVKAKNMDDKRYRIPKITQTHYPEEDKEGNEKGNRERKRALNSAMLQDVLSEYTDDPTVIHNSDVLKEKAMRKRKEIEKYEEENMIRINLSKKDKFELKRMNTVGSMKKELLSFHSLDALDSSEPKAKKSKTTKFKGKKKGSKKKGFKKRR